ncbi:hypothetical protein Y032_0020g128 [Ancylostoma ceylanicum]|uniref:SCP domain-containing protein n=1 Tax=Ancylostoma ceylanicum TaxID=53326 RepID=A0A016V2E9_9BILA|nr:hypothetical protein Y032_0020g128 [Ancylostoma ceylanicum]
MTSLITLVACAFYLLVITTSAEAEAAEEESKKKFMAECNEKLGDKAIGNPHARKMLFAEVQIAKGQWNNLMEYSCDLEKLARNLVTEPLGIVGPPYKVTFDAGDGTLNLKDSAKKWKDQLQKMGEKKKVGCNFSKGKKRYMVACVFE